MFTGTYQPYAGSRTMTPARGADSGGASRFFHVFRYEAKAPDSERPRGADGKGHETVKPVAVMAWLMTLVTQPGALVGDLFAGSGTTGQAGIVEDRHVILCDTDPRSTALCTRRLAKPIQPLMFPG